LRYDAAPAVSDSVYKRIDHAVYRAERAVVVGSLLLMSAVVFLDVVHRSFSGEESKLAMVVGKLAGVLGADMPPGSPAHDQLTAASPWVLFVVFSALAYFGIRSTKRATPVAAPIAAAAAVAGVLVAYGLIRLLLVLVPNGLIWSQDLALVLTLWVGFVGASMCTYENRHLRVEAAQRLLPEKLRPLVAFASGVFTALVCAALLWVSLRYVAFHRQEWLDTEGQGGLFPGMSLPKWVGFLSLPLAFAFMSVRFFVKALGALRGEVEEPLDPVAAVAGISSPSHGVRAGDSVRMPSEVATEALPVARESAIDTMTSRARMVVRDPAAPRPQSKVPTDAHDVLPRIVVADDPDDPLDPERTKELDAGSVRLLDDTRELARPIVSGNLRGDDEEERR
jgi:TRAP-type C4-dicarboxylate transport system permease small subunit